ncbi:ChbG/HpnK family deacetylase [Traorella massiliensis]|uniref:ChbG/HpnK family deacetylase n=1 Tax=Traorella massiliensis TaxID=1903263 RepID=UPI0008F84D7B|nr:ChbG/HpnK family deacetylase [Traorella massiliensis]
MKLLVKGDDYGITKAVTLGIIDAFDNGILTSSGMFTNMEIAPWAAQFVKERPSCCFGIDFNLVCGPCVANPHLIPHLVDQNGRFISSKKRVNEEKWNTLEGQEELLPYEEVYIEVKAQYNRFIELCNRKPAYLCGHSIQTKSMEKAYRTLSEETGVPFCDDVYRKYNIIDFRYIPKINYYTEKENKKITDVILQLNRNPMKIFFDNLDYYSRFEYILLVCHPGYLDAELLKLSSCSIERIRDLEFFLAPEMKDFVKENDIELLSFFDFQ